MDNKYSVYRNIRFNRTYRTIGKMSWWRIVLGVVLMITVLLISGLPSQILATREHFLLAEKLMLYPEWMEKYKPETKAFIEAGVLYQNGNIEASIDAFDDINDFDAAQVMKSRALLKLASEKIQIDCFDDAYNYLTGIEFSYLLEEGREEYISLCEDLIQYYKYIENESSDNFINVLENMISCAIEE